MNDERPSWDDISASVKRYDRRYDATITDPH